MNTQRCHPEAEARKLNAAPTLCMRVISRIGSTRYEFEFTEVLGDVALAELVGEDHHGRQQQPDGSAAANVMRAHANRRSSPGPSTLLTQRAQISGWRGSLPTSSRN